MAYLASGLFHAKTTPGIFTYDEIYCTAAQAAREFNANAILSVYLTELVRNLSTPKKQRTDVDAGKLMELCLLTGHVTCTIKATAQSVGGTMGLAMVGQRALWLNESKTSNREHDGPIDIARLFGVALVDLKFESS